MMVGQRSVPGQQVALALLVDVVEGGVELQHAPELAAGIRQQGAGAGGQALLFLDTITRCIVARQIVKRQF